MPVYTGIVEPLNKTVTVLADTEKEAHKKIWASLDNDEQNVTACIDIVEMKAEEMHERLNRSFLPPGENHAQDHPGNPRIPR
jgi:hypothetical protein